MKAMTTSEYPTRYAAFDNPGVWCEAELPQHRGGFEAVVYHAPVTNEYFLDLTDGLYVEVVSYQGKAWEARLQHTAPTRDRTQTNRRETFATLDAAKAAAKAMIAQHEGLEAVA